MKQATISQTKNQLSALLDLVRHGETIIITDRHQPIARIERIEASASKPDAGRLERLERAGLLRRAKKRAPRRYPKPVKAPGADILQALLQEREESR